MLENLQELEFVCNFCGGDHGATECKEMLCTDCGKTDCEHTDVDKIMIYEAIEMALDDIQGIIPDEDSDILYEQFGDDLPIELIAHVVATYPIPSNCEYLKQQFPIDPPDDGRIWNRSRKFGACFEFAAQAQLYNADYIRELAGSDEEVFLVHGYGRNGGDYIGHAWVEVGDFVIDCGSQEKKFIQIERDEYYSKYSVKYPIRYTFKETLQNIKETGNWGIWSEIPDDIPLKKLP